ncbi:MAG: hypothetical protein QFB87_04635 [Patescibacteria group bacterium]|nr:hypothetical protein [Patescibacteria group bacterium]
MKPDTNTPCGKECSPCNCAVCYADSQDTTAQLREILDHILAGAISSATVESWNNSRTFKSTKASVLEAFSDYISQLELPRKKFIENPTDPDFEDIGYNDCVDDMAATLQQAASELTK